METQPITNWLLRVDLVAEGRWSVVVHAALTPLPPLPRSFEQR